MLHTEPLASKLCTKELSYLHGKDLQGRNEEARRQDGERAPARPWPLLSQKEQCKVTANCSHNWMRQRADTKQSHTCLRASTATRFPPRPVPTGRHGPSVVLHAGRVLASLKILLTCVWEAERKPTHFDFTHGCIDAASLTTRKMHFKIHLPCVIQLSGEMDILSVAELRLAETLTLILSRTQESPAPHSSR